MPPLGCKALKPCDLDEHEVVDQGRHLAAAQGLRALAGVQEIRGSGRYTVRILLFRVLYHCPLLPKLPD